MISHFQDGCRLAFPVNGHAHCKGCGIFGPFTIQAAYKNGHFSERFFLTICDGLNSFILIFWILKVLVFDAIWQNKRRGRGGRLLVLEDRKVNGPSNIPT